MEEVVMARDWSVAVVVGSLRKASFSRRVARALIGLAPPEVKGSIVEIGDLPHYDQDIDDEKRPPEAWTVFRAAIKAADAVLFVTPEYNRSVPGVLKNAIDVGSRPYGQSAWSGKPAGIVSVTPGAMGGFGANHALRQSLVFLDMPILQQPEAYVGNAGTVFAEDGSVTVEATKAFLTNFMARYAAWVETILR
jgi:chromate reductase, NAD(P)H dehydrogenase (quinone)